MSRPGFDPIVSVRGAEVRRSLQRSINYVCGDGFGDLTNPSPSLASKRGDVLPQHTHTLNCTCIAYPIVLRSDCVL
jgi:hypothetical protein